MGKKKADLIAKMKPKFLEGGGERGHDTTVLEKIWKDWEAFASYAFNKSHSTCYAWVAYQTAYLKANHPAEFMAAVLSNNMSDIKKVTFFMEECRRMGTAVLGPDVNESQFKFAVNAEGAIRFGLGAMSGVGEGAVASIVECREEEPYNSIFDFAVKVNLKDCNKRVFEALARGGGFDDLATGHLPLAVLRRRHQGPHDHRAGHPLSAGHTGEREFLASLTYLAETRGPWRFPSHRCPCATSGSHSTSSPAKKKSWGFTSPGTLLDEFKVQLDQFCTPGGLSNLEDMVAARGRTISFGGMVTEAEHKMAKNGRPWGGMTVEDYHGSQRMTFWRDDYIKFREFMVSGWFLYIKGKVQMKQFRGADELEFKVTRIELCQTCSKRWRAGSGFRSTWPRLDDGLVEQVCALIESNQGGVGVTVELHHPDAVLEMPSRRKRVALSSELLDGLEALDGVEYKVLSSGG